MLKMLIIAADAVEPKLYLRDPTRFPNIARMMESGASASYGAYTGKNFKGSYDSGQNWSSIYTGLSPAEHNISTYAVGLEHRKPQMSDFESLSPFWKLLNENGISAGVWAAHSVKHPAPINGYIVGVDYTAKETPDDERLRPRTIQLSVNDDWIRECLDGAPPPRIYPLTLKQQGYDYSEMLGNPALAEKALREYDFSESLINFENELLYFASAIKKAQSARPVDVLWFFTPSTDLIGHMGGIRPENNETLLKAYDLLDAFIGDLAADLAPERTVFLSDHGQGNFGDLVRCSDECVSKEAFGAIEQSVFLPGGFIAMYARNGAFLLSYHTLHGCFVANGTGIKHCEISDMRTLDIYPTLLEMLNIKVPHDRKGFVIDIFHKQPANSDKWLNPVSIRRKSMAFLQCHAVNITDILINEFYLANRFTDITVVGEPKYKEIFLGNPRIVEFVPFERFSADSYDETYCGLYNTSSKLMRYIRIY